MTNHTGVSCRLESTEKIISEIPGARLTALFAPEHGIRGDSPAGRKIASRGIVYSLYGEQTTPTAEMLDEVEVLIFDIQDVGARFYTYIWTMLGSMEAAARDGIRFVVLDRPVPIGGARVEGPVLEKGYESFVGRFQLPIRYGMTPGELSLLLKSELKLQLELDVVPLRGWKRTQWFDETGLIWISPSPNMATLETASVYPGFCLIEGTNLSEGRGTTHPFELVGAPWLENDELLRSLNRLQLPGVLFRAQTFQPWFSKVPGANVSRNPDSRYRQVRFQTHPDRASLSVRGHPASPDGVSVSEQLRSTRRQLLDPTGVGAGGTRPAEIQTRWQAGLKRFLELRESFLLYSRRPAEATSDELARDRRCDYSKTLPQRFAGIPEASRG